MDVIKITIPSSLVDDRTYDRAWNGRPVELHADVRQWCYENLCMIPKLEARFSSKNYWEARVVWEAVFHVSDDAMLFKLTWIG